MSMPAIGGRPASPDVLAAVNRERVDMGRPEIERLRRGRRRDPCGCALARSLEVFSVGESFYCIDSPTLNDGLRPMPPVLRRFMRAFDDGNYPELEMWR